jgi:hypothetical protein
MSFQYSFSERLYKGTLKKPFYSEKSAFFLLTGLPCKTEALRRARRDSRENLVATLTICSLGRPKSLCTP